MTHWVVSQRKKGRKIPNFILLEKENRKIERMRERQREKETKDTVKTVATTMRKELGKLFKTHAFVVFNHISVYFLLYSWFIFADNIFVVKWLKIEQSSHTLGKSKTDWRVNFNFCFLFFRRFCFCMTHWTPHTDTVDTGKFISAISWQQYWRVYLLWCSHYFQRTSCACSICLFYPCWF